MNRNKDLLINTIYFFIGSLGAKVINFVLLPLYTLWLSPSDYGVVDLINSYNNILLMFVGLGVADALVVFPLGKSEDEIKSIFSTALLFHLATCVLFFILFFVVDYFGKASFIGSIADYMWFMFAILVCNTTSRLFQYFCRGIKKMSVFSYTGILSSVLTALFGVLLIPQMGIKGFLMSGLISGVGTIFFIILYSKSFRYFSFKSYSSTQLKDMLRYSIPLIPNLLMWWLILSMNRPLMERTIGIAAVGLFAVAIKIPDIIQMFYSFFHQAWIVTAVEQYGQLDFDSYFNKVLQFLTSFQTIICLGVMLFGQLIFNLFINVRYSDALQFVPILCVCMIFSNIATFLSSIFNANKQTSYIFYSVIIVAVVAAVLNFVLIPTMGIWGACIALLVAQISATLSRTVFVCKYVKIERIDYHLLNIGVCVLGALGFLIESPVIRYLTLITLIGLYVFINRPIITRGLSLVRNRFHK